MTLFWLPRFAVPPKSYDSRAQLRRADRAFFAPAVGVTQTKEDAMKTEKHTKAPWKHSNEDGEPILGTGREFPICYMDTGDEINEADIRLICAAPQLLEFVKFSLKYVPRQEALQAGAWVSEIENG